jgi:hypothetical protein
LRLTPDGKYERIPLREVDQRFVMGTRANVESTKAMATYLIHAVERLAGGPEYGARERHAFKLGCADRLAQRLGDLKWERTRAKQQPTAGGSNLPALRDVYTAHEIANQEFYAKLHGKPPKFSCGSALGSSMDAAYNRGHSAGGGIGLDAQVTRGGTKALPGR